MATVYEIVQGLSQAAANAYDGAHNDDGELVEVGLRREEGDPILDKRVMDGFNVRFSGNFMCLSYMSEVQLKEVYANGFETRIEEQIAEIVTFLKKEYRPGLAPPQAARYSGTWIAHPSALELESAW